MFSGTFYAQHSVTKNLHISPRFWPTIFYQDANSVLLLAHFCAAVLLGSIRKTLCLKLFMIRAWRSIYLCNGNVQENPLCVESCVTKKFSISPLLFSSTIFDRDANSVLLRVTSTPLYSSRLYAQKTLRTIFYQDANSVLLLAHFCTAVLLGSIRKTLCLKLFMIRA